MFIPPTKLGKKMEEVCGFHLLPPMRIYLFGTMPKPVFQPLLGEPHSVKH